MVLTFTLRDEAQIFVLAPVILKIKPYHLDLLDYFNISNQEHSFSIAHKGNYLPIIKGLQAIRYKSATLTYTHYIIYKFFS